MDGAPVATSLVLIVGRAPGIRRRLADEIRALGHSAVEAEGAAEALRRLSQGRFDLVLLDAALSGTDSLGLLGRIKADGTFGHLPVIAVSSTGETVACAARAIALGAEDMLPEGYHPSVFRARVESALERKRQRDRVLADRREIDRLIAAARVIETGSFSPGELGLETVARRGDSIGRLAKVFGHLARRVYDRERRQDMAIRTLRGALLVLAAGTLFGIMPAMGRISAAQGLPPLGVIVWANLLAAALCLSVAFTRHGVPRLTRQDLRFLCAWALVLGCLYTPLTILVAGHVEATTISLIASSRGFIVFLLAAALALEAASLRRFLGLGLGFGAVAAVLLAGASGEGGAPPLWLLAAFALPALLALHTLLLSWRRRSLPASLAVGGMMAISSAVLLPVALVSGTFFSPLESSGAALAVILVLALCTAGALVLAVDLVALTGPVFASQMAYSQTLAGVVWAILLVDEQPSPMVWGALALVIAGVWLVAPGTSGGEFKARFRPVRPSAAPGDGAAATRPARFDAAAGARGGLRQTGT